MKIGQVRELIQGYTADQLRLIIVEMYRLIPRKMIEDKDIDELLKNAQSVVEARRTGRKEALLPDFECVKSDAGCFMEYARLQYYFAPNRVVSKNWPI